MGHSKFSAPLQALVTCMHATLGLALQAMHKRYSPAAKHAAAYLDSRLCRLCVSCDAVIEAYAQGVGRCRAVKEQ